MNYLYIKEFLEKAKTTSVVDVRSPSEFAEGHIPGAINIPLLSDSEREIVGTLYKKSGRQAAIDKGLEIVGPNMYHLASQARKHAYQDALLVYCWRGGMRSENMSWLFELAGLSCEVLTGGYKAYRSQLLHDLSEIEELIVLEGLTGSGKTDMLECMRERGEQVINLEYLANHRGSAFGNIGLGEQPTTPQFQNNVYQAFLQLDTSKRIWIEGESINIGKVNLPETLWNRMKLATVVEICIPKEERLRRLVNEYGNQDRKEMAEAVMRIGKKLGGYNKQKVLAQLEEGKLSYAADILLEYYDKSYCKSQHRYLQPPTVSISSTSGDPGKNAGAVLEALQKTNIS